MSTKTDLLGRFSGVGDGPPVFLPDLTLWYEWHQGRGTLPEMWRDRSLPELARALGVPVWLPVTPWRLETQGVRVVTTEESGERTVRIETPSGTLVARWTLGPDGDWWQVEYPVKTAEDLPAALDWVRARSYALDRSELAASADAVDGDGLLVLTLPRRPYSDLLHEFLGWSEGLVLLGEPQVGEVLAVLEAKLEELVRQVAALPGDVLLCPDNLDGQFISPRAFRKSLAASYQATAAAAHSYGKPVIVHVGGPIRHLVAPLAQTGVDGIEGIAGPPQGNATLAEARALAGVDLTLWGGIPQDYLHPATDRETFESATRQAIEAMAGDGRMVLGVADRVPVEAEIERLEVIQALVDRAA